MEAFRSASTILADSLPPISTGDSRLDKLLGGGFVRGSVTEIAGISGCGKSQLCMQLTANTLEKKLNVIYIDTEQGSSLQRMKEMYRNMSNSALSQDFYGRLLLSSPTSLRMLEIDLMKLLDDEDSISKTSVLIVDSIAAFFRGETATDIVHQLNKVGAILCKIATDHDIAVIMTNHATSRENSDGEWQNMATLGKSWQHVPATRVWMEREGNRRFVSLVKCPWAKEARSQFIVEERGIRLVDSL